MRHVLILVSSLVLICGSVQPAQAVVEDAVTFFSPNFNECMITGSHGNALAAVRKSDAAESPWPFSVKYEPKT